MPIFGCQTHDDPSTAPCAFCGAVVCKRCETLRHGRKCCRACLEKPSDGLVAAGRTASLVSRLGHAVSVSAKIGVGVALGLLGYWRFQMESKKPLPKFDAGILAVQKTRVLAALASPALQLAVEKPAKGPEVSATSKIVIYGAPESNAVARWREEFKMRRISRLDSVSVSDWDEIESLGLGAPLKAAGYLIEGGKGMNIPFFKVDGRFMSDEDLEPQLSRLPLRDVRERADPYIVVYGPEGCAKTKRGMDELSRHGLVYEYRNVNDDLYRPRFEALVNAYRVRSDWPIIDVSGRMLGKPTIEQVLAAYK